jgi:D-glycero-D-manno-heptose 1,7-bisphosphate phosphatase
VTGVSVHICGHHPNASVDEYRQDCECRKPKPGMVIEAMAAHGVGPENTTFVGDLPSDRDAALAAGVGFAWAEDFFASKTDQGEADVEA